MSSLTVIQLVLSLEQFQLWCSGYVDHLPPQSRFQLLEMLGQYLFLCFLYRATVEAVAAPKTKRDRVAELHYITRCARNVKDPNFEVS